MIAPMNISETIKHLQQELQKETTELHDAQEKLHLAQEDARAKGMEIPLLQKKIEEDRHQIYVDNTDADKLKRHINEVQREKLRHQGEFTDLQNKLRAATKEHGKLFR